MSFEEFDNNNIFTVYPYEIFENFPQNHTIVIMIYAAKLRDIKETRHLIPAANKEPVAFDITKPSLNNLRLQPARAERRTNGCRRSPSTQVSPVSLSLNFPGPFPAAPWRTEKRTTAAAAAAAAVSTLAIISLSLSSRSSSIYLPALSSSSSMFPREPRQMSQLMSLSRIYIYTLIEGIPRTFGRI